MATHKELLQQNSAYFALNAADAALKQFDDEKFLAHRDQLSRLRHILRYCRDKLERGDLQLTPIQNLDALQNMLSALKVHLDEFAKSNNQANIVTAEAIVDSILSILVHIPLPSSPNTISQNSIIADYEEEAQKLLKLLKEKVEKFESKFKSLDELLNEKNQESLNNFQKIESEISSQKVRLDTLGSQFTEQFVTAQESRLNKFNSDLNEWKEDFNITLKSETDSIRLENKKLQFELLEFKQKIELNSEDIISQLEKRNSQSAKLLGVSSIIAFAGHHKKQADKEGLAALVFQGISLFLLICMLVYNLFPDILPSLQGNGLPNNSQYFEQKNSASNLPVPVEEPITQNTKPVSEIEALIKHIVMTLIFLIPAGYAAFESARHRKQEHTLRQFELEMAAIHPYFADIPDSPEKEKKRIELSDRFLETIQMKNWKLGRRLL